MQTFWDWLLYERRQELVPQEVLNGYEQGFRQALVQLVGRVRDSVLREKFQEMLNCPIKDGRGQCRSFTDYILSALVRHGIHRQADIDDALSYVYQTMMLDKKTTGEPKATVFGGFDADRAYGTDGNPLEARFKTAVGNAIRNIASGRIPRLLNTQPKGTVSIGQGRGEMPGTVSVDQIAGRPDSHAGLGELVNDIKMILHRKERAYGLPLVALFGSIMSGQRTAEQRQLFGDRAAKMGRQVIVSTIKDYAQSSGNHHLLQLLQRVEDPGDVQVARTPSPVQVPKPTFSSTKDKDFASILQVVDRLGRPAGSADLGRYRRRWLEYSPRDAASGHRNRLEEVLTQMVWDGVLRAIQTGRGAVAYLAGPNADRYRQAAAV